MVGTRDDDSIVGAVVAGRYRLTRKLGAGGMGEVYAAERLADGARFALKFLLPEFAEEPRVIERFLEEAVTSQRIVHPNVVRVFESDRAEDRRPFLVMELLEGVPLSAYTVNGGRVPLGQAASILHGVLAGLACAHAQGIVHRDLKPDNVFLAREASGQFSVKLLDFGIAKVMDLAGGAGTRTRTGMLLGTPAYMSPEQVQSSKDVDSRSDLFSAGVLFYEMVTGRPAFPAPTEYARLFAVLHHVPEPVERVDPQLAVVASLVARALDKDKNRRFQTAVEMAQALQESVGTLDAGGLAPASHLSRLPEVPSIFAPSVVPRANTAALAAPVVPGPPIAPTLGSFDVPPAVGPSGTLASLPARPISTPPPRVDLVGGHGGTLPSKDLPMLDPVTRGAPRLGGGVAPAIVLLLVLAALFFGFGIGYLARGLTG